MKALPKLSKAQQAAWARVLEWRSTHPLARSFRAGGTAKWRDNLDNTVVASDATLKALLRKGLLVSAEKVFSFDRYTIHPDYLPSEPDAAPEAGNPFSLRPGEIPAPIFHMGHGWEMPSPIADAAATEDRPTTDEARLMDTITELRARVAELEAAFVEESSDLNATALRELALRTQVAELEAANETMRGHIVAFEQARDFWRTKCESANKRANLAEVVLGVQRAASEQWEARAKAAEALLETFNTEES